MTDDGRDRGVLAPIDRKFLSGEKQYEHRQSAYNRREQIRDRIENGFLDFSLIAEEMDVSEREKIFRAGDRSREERRELERGMADLIRFLYLGLGRSRFEQVLREGVQEAEFDLGTTDEPLTTDVNLEVEPQRDYNLKETAERIDEGDWRGIDPNGAVGFLKFASQTPGFDAEQLIKEVYEMAGADNDEEE